MKAPDIIIIRGAPGSGKSTTAKCLAEYFPKGVRLEVDSLRNMVISVDWKNQQEHINILNISIKMVLEFHALGFTPVIVVDTFSGNKLESYLANLKDLNSKLNVIIFGLYVSEEELKKRIEARGPEEFRDFNICKRLNSELQKNKFENETYLNTSGLTSARSAQMIVDQLNSIASLK